MTRRTLEEWCALFEAQAATIGAGAEGAVRLVLPASLLGYGISMLIAHAIPSFRDAHVPWWAVVLSFGSSGGVGVISDIVPAAKAAALDPIEVLRYE